MRNILTANSIKQQIFLTSRCVNWPNLRGLELNSDNYLFTTDTK